jgi:hypothetical protein
MSFHVVFIVSYKLATSTSMHVVCVVALSARNYWPNLEFVFLENLGEILTLSAEGRPHAKWAPLRQPENILKATSLSMVRFIHPFCTHNSTS